MDWFNPPRREYMHEYAESLLILTLCCIVLFNECLECSFIIVGVDKLCCIQLLILLMFASFFRTFDPTISTPRDDDAPAPRLRDFTHPAPTAFGHGGKGKGNGKGKGGFPQQQQQHQQPSMPHGMLLSSGL